MRAIDRLLTIMDQLRTPGHGCAWDLDQTFATIAPYTIEESYEVADAIERADWNALREELGDLLFQVVFHSRMAAEQDLFDFDDVAAVIADKMVRRHPHIFTAPEHRSADGQAAAWETTKAAEREAKGEHRVLDGVAATLPPMMRALKLQARAARVGFDWPDAADVLAKVDEEANEIKREIDDGGAPARLEDEVGDLLFVCVNLARKLAVDPERALKRANAKFVRRFNHIEDGLKAMGRHPSQASLAEMEDLWTAAKDLEKKGELPE